MLLARPVPWLDEAMLALNVMRRPFGRLLEPLDYDQAAPPLFLLAGRLAGLAGGGAAVALRGIPFLAGLGVLLITWRLGRRFVSPAAGALAVLLAALSPTLIYYSAEFKPYITDALVSIALLALAGRVALHPASRASWLALLAGGLTALAASYTAPFVLATGGLALFAVGAGRRDRDTMLGASLLGATWLLAFIGIYSWYEAGVAANPYLQSFWADSFLGRSHSVSGAGWKLVMAVSLPLPFPAVGLSALALLGAWGVLAWLAAHTIGIAGVAVLCAPIGLASLASLANLYPIEGRLLTFAAPCTLLLVAAGLARGLRLQAPAGRLRGALVALAIAGLAIGTGAVRGTGPGRELGDPTAIRLVQARPAGTLAYLLPGGGPKWVYLTTDWESPDLMRLDWYARVLSWGGEAFRNAPTPEGIEPAGRPPLRPPGTTHEVLAYAPGTEGGAGLAAWAEAEVDRLLDMGYPEIWLYGGPYHPRVLPRLLGAFEARGVRAERQFDAPAEVVVRLRVPPGQAPAAALP